MTDQREFRVLVDDNFHYMDEEYRYTLGRYDSADAAIADCKRIVDDFLIHNHEPGMTAQDLWETYRAFGEDPFILTDAGEPPEHSSWSYARLRCEELCREA